MLALHGLDARICPERGAHTRLSNGVAWPRTVPGIGATAAPTRLERKPGATRHGLDAVLFCHVLFLLLRLLQRSERRLPLVRSLLPLVQPAGRGPGQAAAIGAVK